MNRGQQSNGRPGGTIFSAGARNDEPGQAGSDLPNDHKPKADKPVHNHDGHGSLPNDSTWFKWGGGAAVIIVAILIAAALALVVTFKPASEANLVDNSKFQAVFLTNDQVYFGKITEMNSKYLVLTKIYYLQTAASTSKTTGSNISLVKLGCELHKPQDQMIVSLDQVSFWENLQTDGQVAKAVKSYEDSHPNGVTCDNTQQTANPVQGNSTTNTTQNQTQNQNTNTNTPNKNQ